MSVLIISAFSISLSDFSRLLPNHVTLLTKISLISCSHMILEFTSMTCGLDEDRALEKATFWRNNWSHSLCSNIFPISNILDITHSFACYNVLLLEFHCITMLEEMLITFWKQWILLNLLTLSNYINFIG